MDKRIFAFIAAADAARRMREAGVLTQAEYEAAEAALRRKYKVEESSIYRDLDLLCPRFRANMSHHKEVAEAL